jgi:hypothetical protein
MISFQLDCAVERKGTFFADDIPPPNSDGVAVEVLPAAGAAVPLAAPNSDGAAVEVLPAAGAAVPLAAPNSDGAAVVPAAGVADPAGGQQAG